MGRSIRGKARFSLIAAAAMGGFIPTLTGADLIDTTWLGGTGSWHDPSQWSGGVVPNNAGATTYHAVVSGGTANASSLPHITIDALSLAAPATLGIGINFSVTGQTQVDGNVLIGGRMTVGPAGSLVGHCYHDGGRHSHQLRRA